MRKHINSATEQYQDEYTDNWVLDDTPTEGSFNAVTSDGVAKAIAEGGGGSSYTAGDGIAISEGEISAKVDGTTVAINANGELEALGGDDVVLTYNTSTWSDFITAYNAGKNIRVVETFNGSTYEGVLFEYNPNGSPYGYAKFTATTMNADGGSVKTRWYEISNTDSGVWTHGAGSLQGNLSGQGAISVRPDSRKISLTLDGSSLTQSSSGLAVANPIPAFDPSADVGKVLQVTADGLAWVSLT